MYNHRRVAKIINYSIAYGAGPFRISQELKISIKEASNIISNYFDRYPGIRKYIDDTIKKGFEHAPHRSLLRATGVIRSEDDFERPFIGVANSYIDLIPGHVHLQEFGKIAKKAIREAGAVPFEFNTIGVDDGIAMGHIGMRYSLASRELIADCVETVVVLSPVARSPEANGTG